MATKTDKIKRIQAIALTLLVISGLVNYLDRSTLSIANASIRSEMHLTATQMGLLLSAFSLAYAFSQLPIGAMLDRFGARLVLGLGMFFWSLAQIAAGFVGSLQQFVMARVVLGIGEAPQFPAGAKVFSEWFPVKARGKPIGLFAASSTIAPALAPPLLTGLMLSLGWRGMFITMGVVGVLAAIAWYMLYRDRRNVPLEPGEVEYLCQDDAASAAEHKITAADYGALLSSRTSWGIIFGFMGVIYMVWLYLTWLPSYLSTERHLTIAKAGWVLAIPYLAGTCGMLTSGIVADWLLARGLKPIASRKYPIFVGLACGALFTVPAAFTPSTTMAVVYISLAMFFVNMSSGGAWALVSVSAPRRLVSSLGGLQNFGGYLAGSAAPIITGRIVDTTGSFVNALLISAAIAFCGALVYLFVVKDPIPDRVANG
ncbi:MAG: D-galactonate transporter [Caulobacteraceae bacterium]|nr:D-galactonate transporter [Caulobacteraceae bacterium]